MNDDQRETANGGVGILVVEDSPTQAEELQYILTKTVISFQEHRTARKRSRQ